MYIVNKVRTQDYNDDKVLYIGGLFRENMPTQVVLVVDAEEEKIRVLEVKKATDFGVISNINGNCVIMPEWILEETKANEFFLIIGDNGEKYISPKTDEILP